jgi:hypothetical protein
MEHEGIFVSILAIAFLVPWLMCTMLAAWVADEKNRSPIEGFLLGLLFGPLGVLVEVGLPTLKVGDLEARREFIKQERAGWKRAGRDDEPSGRGIGRPGTKNR